MTTAVDNALLGGHDGLEHQAPDDLKGLLSGVLARFDEADRRNEALLREMHGQIEALRAEARHARPAVPEHYRPGFERIEDGMTLLATRLAETYTPRALSSDGSFPLVTPATPVAPAAPEVGPISNAFVAVAPLSPSETTRMNQAPLMSAAGPDARARFGKPAHHADTFDVIESAPGDPAESWSAEEVAALNEIYSTRDMLFAPTEPSHQAEAVSAPAEPLPSADRDWIDGRLSEIARLIVEARPAASPDKAIDALSERFDTLERHLTEALRGIARVEDFGGLQHIEGHIANLTTKVEQVHAELTRFEAIESRLGVIEQRVEAAPEAAAPHAEADFHAVAIAAAEAAAGRVAQLVARDQERPQASDRVSEVHDMLTSYMAERRHGDEQTAAILDTLQQAMVHLLDRVDTRTDATAQHTRSASDAPLSAVVDDQAPFREHPAEPMHEIGHREPGRLAPHGLDAPGAAEAVGPAAVEDIADPVARQRASLQISAQRAAQAQREKLAAEQAGAKGLAAKAPEAKKASGWRRLLVRGLVLAVAVSAGAGTMTALMPEASSISSAQLKSGVSPVAADASNEHGETMHASVSGEISQPPETVNSSVTSVITNDKPRATPMTGIMIQDQPPQVAGASPGSASGVPAGPATRVSAIGAVDAAFDEDHSKAALGLPPLSVGPSSLRTAAAKGDPSAEFEVASRLAEGKGTDQNLALAVRWYQRSASKGFVQSQYRLGTLYERGLGVTKDLNRAKVWYQRAAEQGNVKSMHNLAVLAAGRSGSVPDYATATKWFALAAQNGLSDSQFNLAVLTESGLGVPKDLVAAAEWYTIAARSGDRESIRRRDALRAQLGPSDQARVDAFVQSWQPLIPDRLANDSLAAGQAWKQRQPGTEDAADNG